MQKQHGYNIWIETQAPLKSMAKLPFTSVEQEFHSLTVLKLELLIDC